MASTAAASRASSKTRVHVRGSTGVGVTVPGMVVGAVVAGGKVVEIGGARATKVYEGASSPRFSESWEVYPFNSGHFMCIQLKGVEAEPVRVRLLEKHGVGTIAAGGSDLRIAFSCLPKDDVEPLFEAVHDVVQELR